MVEEAGVPHSSSFHSRSTSFKEYTRVTNQEIEKEAANTTMNNQLILWKQSPVHRNLSVSNIHNPLVIVQYVVLMPLGAHPIEQEPNGYITRI